MNPAITVELQFFLISILWGGILLLAYDVLRIFRRLIKQDAFFIAVQDLIFWVVASLFIFAMIYEENNGIIRGFSIAGILIGAVLYHYLLSEVIVKAISGFIKLLLRPFTLVIHQVKRFILFVTSRVKKAGKNLLFRLKKLVKSVRIALNTRKRKHQG